MKRKFISSEWSALNLELSNESLIFVMLHEESV